MIPGAIIAISFWALLLLLPLLLRIRAVRLEERTPIRWVPEPVNLDWLYGLEDDAEVMLTADDREDMRAWGVTW